MIILYGIASKYKDVTVDVLNCPKDGNVFVIPDGDYERSQIFGDPVHGIVKHIIVKTDLYTEKKYESDKKVFIDYQDLFQNPNVKMFEKARNGDSGEYTQYVRNLIRSKNPSEKLGDIHRLIKLKHGDFNSEVPEQEMACKFISEDDIVLELGSNIGRNTIVISLLLKDDKNFITMETDKTTCSILKENRDKLGMNFQIESSALSKRNLIQKEWDTLESDELLPGYFKVDTISYEDLKKKYSIDRFTTIVADCEGGFYYILKDMPEVLKDVNKILIENNFHNFSHKQYVDKILLENGFKCVFNREGGWQPCYSCFFQTWIKQS